MLYFYKDSSLWQRIHRSQWQSRTVRQRPNAHVVHPKLWLPLAVRPPGGRGRYSPAVGGAARYALICSELLLSSQ
jgi:hypothetical protein